MTAKIIGLQLKILCLCSTLLLASCTTTQALYSDKQYSEQIDSFLIAEDGKQLVIIGESYHYIFPVDAGFGEFLKSSERTAHADKIKLDVKSVEVDNANNVSASFEVKYDATDLPDSFKAAGFKALGKTAYVLEKPITGKRYRAKERLPAEYRFNQTYEITVSEWLSPPEILIRAPLTPVTLVIDAGLTVVFIGALIFVMIPYDPGPD